MPTMTRPRYAHVILRERLPTPVTGSVQPQLSVAALVPRPACRLGKVSMDLVHGTLASVKTIPAGQFKQTCLRLLDEVRDRGESFVVTKRGVPVARVVPVPRESESDWAGALCDRGKIVGDLVEPALDPADWEALR